jgi:hypothetical protein
MSHLSSDEQSELRDLRHMLGWCFSRAQHGISSFKVSERQQALADITYHCERFRNFYDPERKLKVSRNAMWMGQNP